jgi:uncharacterized protein (TIGR00255 family)
MGVRSMTGFGQATGETDRLRFAVELRGVNHRYSDIRVRVPDALAPWEGELRRRTAEVVRRGRLDLTVTVDSAGAGAGAPVLNTALLGEALRAARVLSEDHGVPGTVDVGSMLALPGMFRVDGGLESPGEADRATLFDTLDRALQALDAERRREGSELRQDLLERAAIVSALLGELTSRAEEVPDRLRERLLERLRTLDATLALDPARVAQEAVFLAERADVTEETVRLAGHVEALRALLGEAGDESVGKRLDFLLQEIHRETNTVCAKAADLEVTRRALSIRVEVERMREQVQNVE